MRRAGVAAAGTAGIAWLGCGGADDDAPPGATPGVDDGTPRPGGIAKLRQTTAYPNFNPFGPGISALTQGLFTGFTIFDHLWYVPTDTGEVIPFLATEIETVDAQEIRVTMDEAVFHDRPPVNGRDVRASDVKASVEKFAEQVPFGFSWLQEVFDRIETPDERTVVYFQNRPWAWFFTSSNAGSPITSSILPAETLDREDILNDRPIGSGRWMLDGHDAGTNVRLRKFPNWREPGLPYLDGIDYFFAPDDTLAQSAFAAGDLDNIAGLNRREAEDLERRLGDAIVTSSDLSRSYRCLMLKNEPPFDDPAVRHGINLALDRDQIRQALNLGEGEFSGPLPPAHEAFVLDEDDPDLREYFRHDPNDARARLEAAGFPFDQEFVLKYSNFGDAPDLAAVIGQQLQQVGINVRVPGAEDLTVWLSNTLGPGNFQMTSFTHLAYEDPSLPLSFYVAPNQMGYENPEVEAAFQAAAEELDEEARVEATKEAQRAIIRDWAPMLNLYSARTFTARWSHYKGVVEGRGSFGLFNSRAWLDR